MPCSAGASRTAGVTAHLGAQPELLGRKALNHLDLQAVVEGQAALVLLPTELPRHVAHVAIQAEGVLHGGLRTAIAGHVSAPFRRRAGMSMTCTTARLRGTTDGPPANSRDNPRSRHSVRRPMGGF